MELCDGPTGLKKARSMWLDLVVLDLGPPGICSWDVFATLRAEGLDIPVVAVTGDHDPDTARRADLTSCGISSPGSPFLIRLGAAS